MEEKFGNIKTIAWWREEERNGRSESEIWKNDWRS